MFAEHKLASRIWPMIPIIQQRGPCQCCHHTMSTFIINIVLYQTVFCITHHLLTVSCEAAADRLLSNSGFVVNVSASFESIPPFEEFLHPKKIV